MATKRTSSARSTAKKRTPTKSIKSASRKPAGHAFSLPLRQSQPCPVELLRLDLANPRMQTGGEWDARTEEDVIEVLADIAALDELVTSICTNEYLNLEPLIVWSQNGTPPFTVLEGNRRLAAIRIIRDPELAKKLGVRVPEQVSGAVLASIKSVLVYRVESPSDARAFIGFKHINGPQRWDAYAKAQYVANWYKSSNGSISVDEIAARMGDNNNTLRAYIYAILILEQAESERLWTLKERTATGRFAFSHLYTAIGRKEYQEDLGLNGGWSEKPPIKPVPRNKLQNLAEVLVYLYGSKSENRPALVKSQNPDLKDIGLAISSPAARSVLRARGSLDDARDVLKEPLEAFVDALTSANLRIAKAISLLPKYEGGSEHVAKLIDEIWDQADTLKTMHERKASRRARA